MGKVKDLLGQRNNGLLVIRRFEETTKDFRVLWVCRCDCGNETILTSVAFGRAKSCGCKRTEPKHVGCRVDGCTREHSARGFCAAHYMRFKKGAQLDVPLKVIDSSRVCAFEGCDRGYRRNGWCDSHAAQLERYGTQFPLRPWAKTRAEYAERFWSRVDKTNIDGCWPWTGSCNDGGYGTLGGFRSTNSVLANRVAYQLANDVVLTDPKLLVCHVCDNRICVRPSHLFLGSHDDNAHDAVVKGRTLKGSLSPRAKLTEAQVAELRSRSAQGEKNRELATLFGVSLSSVRAILARVTWKHVP